MFAGRKLPSDPPSAAECGGRREFLRILESERVASGGVNSRYLDTSDITRVSAESFGGIGVFLKLAGYWGIVFFFFFLILFHVSV